MRTRILPPRLATCEPSVPSSSKQPSCAITLADSLCRDVCVLSRCCRGECYCKLGNHAAAAPLLEEAVSTLRAVYGDAHIHVGYVRRWLQTNARKDTHGPRYKEYSAEQETPYERRAKRRRRRD